MIIACDPGANGAFAFMLNYEETFTRKIKSGYLPILDTIRNVKPVLPITAGIEQIGLRQGDTMKAHAIKELNQNVGRAKFCFEINGIEYTEVDPKTWEYKYGLVEHTDKKSRARDIAQVIFPYLKVTLADADALLIADYLWHITYNIPFETRKPNIITELTITREVTRGETHRP
jgi:hypothetical protein